MPQPTCPHCDSTDTTRTGEVASCNDCGHLFRVHVREIAAADSLDRAA